MIYAIVLGTRPEIIKFSPIIREFMARDLEFTIIHTNQHYTYEMDRIFFEELQLPTDAVNLNVGSGPHGAQTGRMMERIERTLMDIGECTVLVEGDTNTVLAGAIVGAKIQIPVAHVEAGLRSFDRTMPEEINRIVADHVSDYLFAPTNVSKGYLLKEGLPEERIFVVGNTIVDATLQNLRLTTHEIISNLGLKHGNYFLATFHRQENVDNRERLSGIIKGLNALAEEHDMDVIVPMHPRTEKNVNRFNMGGEFSNRIRVIKPVGYLEFLALLSRARAVLTDSGGVQEETCILNVPCITLRDNTERPETVELGKNIIAGTKPEGILEAVRTMLSRKLPEENPYGDGTTAKKIVDILENA